MRSRRWPSACSIRCGTPGSRSVTPCGTAEECVVARPRAPRRGSPSMLDLRHLARGPGARRSSGRVGAGDRGGRPRGVRRGAARRRPRRNERVRPSRLLLEPELKEGAGGLRDIQSLRWLEAVSGVARGRRPARVRRSGTSWRPPRSSSPGSGARSISRPTSGPIVLPLELQPPIARAMGFEDEPRLLADDGLMRAMFEHARAVRWITRRRVGTACPQRAAPRPVPPIDGRRRGCSSPRRRGRDRCAASPGAARCDRGRRSGGRGRVDRRGPRRLPAAAPRVARPA